jgi:hypothetical protein
MVNFRTDPEALDNIIDVVWNDVDIFVAALE